MLFLALLLVLFGGMLTVAAVIILRDLARLLRESREDPHFDFFRWGNAEIALFFSMLGGIICLCFGAYILFLVI